MAAFVVSVEKISTTFGTTAGATSNTVNLSKSQDETQCVPFCTARTTAAGSDRRENDWFGLEMIDNSGTPAVRIHRNATATVSEKHVDIFVIEFGSNITVHQGTASINIGPASATISPALAATNRAFCIFSIVGTGGGSDDFNDTYIRASFASTSSVSFSREVNGAPDWDIYWYIVESDGTDFLTEYVQDAFTNSETGPTNLTLSNSVTLANAFVSESYQVGESADDLRDAICNVALTGTTTLTWYRDHGTFAGATGTIGCWVVRASSSEFNTQRFALAITASTTNDQTITSIDQTKAVVLNSNHVGGGTWSTDSSTDGTDVEDRQNSMVFQADTTVRAQQQNAEASGGTGSLRFEVIEFELEGAGPAPSPPPTLALLGVGV